MPLTSTQNSAEKMRGKKRTAAIIGLLMGTATLYVLFRGTDWAALGAALRSVHPGWIAAAFVAKFGALFMKTYRFKFIVGTAAHARFRWLLSATSLGILAHATLPVRPGNIVRAFVLGRLAKIPFPKCFALVLVDNTADMAAVATIMAVGISAIPAAQEIVLPATMFDTASPITFSAYAIRPAAWAAGGAVLGLLCSLVFAYFQEQRVTAFIDRIGKKYAPRYGPKVGEVIQYFAEGLHIFRSGKEVARAMAITAVTWSINLFMHACIWNAFDLPWNWATPLIVQALILASMALPGAPAFVGAYHIAVAVAVLIAAPNADVSTAKAAAIMNHIVYFLPIFICGAVSLYVEHIRPSELNLDATAVTE